MIWRLELGFLTAFLVGALLVKWALDRDFSEGHRPMNDQTTAPQIRPCAECPAEVPRGTTYCSTRCRNAADDHNDYGDC